MRARLALCSLIAALATAPAATASPPALLEYGPHAGSTPPAPVFDPASPIRSFKIEVLGM